MNKRKIENNDTGEEPAVHRPRTASSSEPLQDETKEPEKREVLRRLFGRCIIQNNNNNNNPPAAEEVSDDDYEDCLDENEDPLLDIVPVNLDPEQLGFLVCAQETLRFLYGRGFTVENPLFVRLRSRLLQGINDIAAA